MAKSKDKKNAKPLDHRCSECGSAFPSKYALKQHRYVCTGEAK